MVALLAQALARRGHSVHVIAARGSALQGVHVIPTIPASPGAIGTSDPEWEHLLAARSVVRQLRPDVVIDHSGPLGALLLGDLPVPALHVAHGRLDGVTGAAFEEAARRHPASRLIAISQSQRDLAPHLPFVGVCHNGLDVREAPFSHSGTGYLLFVGRMTPDKGPAEAIRIARAAGRPLVMAAKCREAAERRYFADVIEPMLDSDIHWLGEVDAARRYRLMAAADALVFPISWPEPFGMVMIEAMACGTPVLATSHGAVPEVVRDGVTGFVRRHPDDLVECVGAVAQIDRRACREHVHSTFSADRMARSYERVAKEALLRA